MKYLLFFLLLPFARLSAQSSVADTLLLLPVFEVIDYEVPLMYPKCCTTGGTCVPPTLFPDQRPEWKDTPAKLERSARAFPNPARESVTIPLSGERTAETAHVQIFTADGRQLSSIRVAADRAAVVPLPHNLGSIRTLLLRVRTPEGSQSTHRIVQR